MAEIELVGVPFDGYGRPGNQALAADRLRASGLVEAFDGHRVSETRLDLPAPDARRGPDTGLMNEPALVAMTDALAESVAGALAASRFPVVVGGDCSTLLGIVDGLAAAGAPGLVFVDGHEDAMPLDVSEDGEAANAELGLLLGVTGGLLRGPLSGRRGVLGTGALAMLGMRDAEWRRRFAVGSLGDTGVWLRDAVEVAADPAGLGTAAAQHVAASADAWWLHVDLDVLDPDVFPAQGLPGVPDDPGGLTWDQLTDLLVAALGVPGCVGWSMAIYDPEQDPDGTGARQVVDLAAAGAAVLG